MTQNSRRRLRNFLDFISIVFGTTWGAFAIGILHWPIWLIVIVTAIVAFTLGWIRWGIRDRLSEGPDS